MLLSISSSGLSFKKILIVVDNRFLYNNNSNHKLVILQFLLRTHNVIREATTYLLGRQD